MKQSKIIASTNDQRTEFGIAEIREFSSQEVLVKAAQKLALFWGIALLSVFLPVVHFVLVPLFLVLGVFLSARAFKLRWEMKSGEVLCPRCKSPLFIKSAIYQHTFKEICQNCAVEVRIQAGMFA